MSKPTGKLMSNNDNTAFERLRNQMPREAMSESDAKQEDLTPNWSPRLPEERIAKNFEEIKPPLSNVEAMFEAQRCFYCEYDVPCMRGCPTQIDIPRFIKQISEGEPIEAAKTILNANIFGAVCARVCPVEKLCESLCICNTIHEKPIPIGKLQRFATDSLMRSGELPFKREEPTGKRVAIVGSGPAGVAAAFELARRGHDVVIFEKDKLAGGLDRYGIAEYKIGDRFVQEEMNFLLQIGGVEIKTEREPINENSLAMLREDYDAVMLAVGLGMTRRLDVTGEDIPWSMDALSFIRRVKTQPLHTIPVGNKVIVIGAGNTAIDAATQAKRLGAESVIIAYRRGRENVKCTDHEYDISVADGCQWVWNASPVEVIPGEDGRVKAVKFRNNKAKENGEEEFFELPCDHFVKATGQVPYEWLTKVEGLKLYPNGTVRVDPMTWQTSVKGLFAAGDCVKNAKEVVNAVYEGKRAALSIDGMLTHPAGHTL